MYTKLQAASLATACGIAVVIAKGDEPDVIKRLVSGESIGTRFLPTAEKLESRERWMLAGLCLKGKLIVDEGAFSALKKDKGSLLGAGIVAVEGLFQRGDLVRYFRRQRKPTGLGYNQLQLRRDRQAQRTALAQNSRFARS